MTWKLEQPMTRERFAAMCAGMTRREIAEELGITIWSVIHYEDRYQIKPQPAHRRPTREKFAAMAERHTKAEIARICGVTYSSVSAWEAIYGIKCRPAKRGRQAAQQIHITTPCRLCWLVQGGVWTDLRQCMGRGE